MSSRRTSTASRPSKLSTGVAGVGDIIAGMGVAAGDTGAAAIGVGDSTPGIGAGGTGRGFTTSVFRHGGEAAVVGTCNPNGARGCVRGGQRRTAALAFCPKLRG